MAINDLQFEKFRTFISQKNLSKTAVVKLLHYSRFYYQESEMSEIAE